MKSKLRYHFSSVIPYFLIMLAAILMLAPQIHSRAFISGLDYYFHMSRTYETAMQLKTGHLSYFLSIFSWDHNARIVNALYGPIGGYVSGLILLIVGSWYHWEICMSVLALLLSGMTMYHLGSYWHVEPSVNFLISLLYMMSTPINDFVFKQTFNGFASALVPIAALLASETLIQHDINPVKLALTLVLLIEIHLMTFVLSMAFLIPCFLINLALVRRSRLRFVKHMFEAAGLLIVLSFNVWGAILEVFGANLHHIIPTFPGLRIGSKANNTIMNTYPLTSLSQTPSVIGLGVAIVIAVTVILWIINLFHENYVVNIFMLIGIFFVWTSSVFFPWAIVRNRFPLMCTIIQFPKRCLPMGLVFIYLVMGIISTQYISNKDRLHICQGAFLIFLCIIVGWSWKNNYNYLEYKISDYQSLAVINWDDMDWQTKPDSNQLRHSLQSDHPGQFLELVSKPIADYLPTEMNYHSNKQYWRIRPYHTYNRFYLSHRPFDWRAVNHGEVINLNSNVDRTQTVPFAKYAHTQVSINHQRINPHVNIVGAMKLPLCTGRNEITIRYQPSEWFKFGILISIVSWLALLIAGLYEMYLRYGRYIPM